MIKFSTYFSLTSERSCRSSAAFSTGLRYSDSNILRMSCGFSASKSFMEKFLTEVALSIGSSMSSLMSNFGSSLPLLLVEKNA